MKYFRRCLQTEISNTGKDFCYRLDNYGGIINSDVHIRVEPRRKLSLRPRFRLVGFVWLGVIRLELVWLCNVWLG